MAIAQHQIERVTRFFGGASGAPKIKKAHIASAAATETASGITLPTKCVVKDVWIDVITIDAGETVDVGTDGTSNDPDGYLDGAALGVAGIIKGSLANGAVTKGALLRENEDGAGAWVPSIDATAGGDNVTYTASAAGAAFDIYVEYVEL